MPWIVGIDEAGYGPNLGPLVMSAVACHAPDHVSCTSLWFLLENTVRRVADRADYRIIVDDSKKVYSSKRGLHELEKSVLSLLAANFIIDAHLEMLLNGFCPTTLEELRAECWYTGQSQMPVAASATKCRAHTAQFLAESSSSNLRWTDPSTIVICARRFNELLDIWGTKSAVLAHALSALLHDVWQLSGDVLVFVDKHGGRNTYAAMLQNALPDAMITTITEGAERSEYCVLGSGRKMRIIFQPRADDTHFCVALASMASKYIRELLMREFNAFWRRHVPVLRPTAGYPIDAVRFFAEIQPVLEQLRVARETIWRRK